MPWGSAMPRMEVGRRHRFGWPTSCCWPSEPFGYAGSTRADPWNWKESHLSSQVHNPALAAGADPQPVLNFFSRRRITISLIGFSGLFAFNALIRQTIPHNPLDVSDRISLLALGLLLIGLAIRTWSAGTLNKSRQLTTCGPYAVTRNPLYIGSFLMMFAFCLLCRDLPTFLFVAGPMSFLYFLQVRFEERRLERLFSDRWHQYCKETPRLFPRRSVGRHVLRLDGPRMAA